MRKSRFFTGVFLAISAFALSVCGVSAAEKTVPELTIWLDEDSEYVVRRALANYSWLFRSYGGWNENYPEFTWELVDKSYLTPEQFRAELERELQEENGPDLIYMDEYNGISPQYMMEAGYLTALENITKKGIYEGEWKYLPGTLEAGQLDGTQYVLPVYLQCPVMFGKEEVLTEAGFDTEKEYESLEQLLKALIAASDISGKQIFENDSIVNWMEAYCMPREENEAEEKAIRELKELLSQTRERCGEEERFFSPYEALGSGGSLLSGCAVESNQKAAQNLGMMEKEEEIVFLSIPAWDGEIRAVITQSAAINANTRYPNETAALARAFQESYVNSGTCSVPYFPALEEYWDTVLDASYWSTGTAYEKAGRQLSSTERISRQFRKCTQEAIGSAFFQNTPDSHVRGLEEATEPQEKKVLTVGIDDQGMGEDYPVYRWLRAAAEAYSDTELLVQLMTVPEMHGGATIILEMEQAGAGVDVFLSGSAFAASDYPYPEEAEYYADLTPLLGDTNEPRTVKRDGRIKGISYGIRSMEDGGTGWDYIFAVSENSERKEEAVEFCLEALENENYRAAVTEAGILPIK